MKPAYREAVVEAISVSLHNGIQHLQHTIGTLITHDELKGILATGSVRYAKTLSMQLKVRVGMCAVCACIAVQTFLQRVGIQRDRGLLSLVSRKFDTLQLHYQRPALR